MHDVSVAHLQQTPIALAQGITLAGACWDHSLLDTLLRTQPCIMHSVCLHDATASHNIGFSYTHQHDRHQHAAMFSMHGPVSQLVAFLGMAPQCGVKVHALLASAAGNTVTFLNYTGQLMSQQVRSCLKCST